MVFSPLIRHQCYVIIYAYVYYCIYLFFELSLKKKTSFACVQYRHLGIELQIKGHKHFTRKSIKRKRKKVKISSSFHVAQLAFKHAS